MSDSRFTAPFVIQERDGSTIKDGDVLPLMSPNNDGKVVALVHLKRLTGAYLEVVEVRPVLDREPERAALASFRQGLLQERS